MSYPVCPDTKHDTCKGMLVLPAAGVEIVTHSAGKHSCCQTWSSHGQTYQFAVMVIKSNSHVTTQ